MLQEKLSALSIMCIEREKLCSLSFQVYPHFWSVRDVNVPREYLRQGLDERQRGQVKIGC
jgi:hypothetical protein